jgi:hypothetical protein
MTMVNGVIQGDAAYLYADTAFFDPATGRVLAYDCKILRGTGALPWAVGVTFLGNYRANDVLHKLNAERVDDLVEQLPGVIAAFRAKSAECGAPKTIVRLLLAAWDEECGQPRLFVAGDALQGFTRSEWCPPGVTELSYFTGSESDFSHHWRGQTPCDLDAFDVERDAIALFEEARLLPYKPDDQDMALGTYIGGALQMTTISRDGVKAVVLRDWHDVIGQPIRSSPTA